MTAQKGCIYSGQEELFGSKEVIGYGSDCWFVKEIHRDKANEIIIKNHYSHKIYSATYIHLGVFIFGELLGVLQYGYAMNPASCGSVVEGTKMYQYLELNRMWMDDKAVRNSESKAISYSIKYIRSRWPKIKWIQSFADERCGGLGIVYQACSFGFYGEHTAVFWTLEGTIYHNSIMTRKDLNTKATYLQQNKDQAIKESLRQFRYIKFIDQRWASRCRFKRLPYLKHYRGD